MGSTAQPRNGGGYAHPLGRVLRIETGNPGIGEHFEWLVGVLARIDGVAGITTTYDDARVARDLDSRIASARRNLRIAEELRAVIVRPSTGEEPTTT